MTNGLADDYTAGCLLDYNYFKKHYKMIAIDLSKQQALDADPKVMQQISFTGNLDGEKSRVIFYFIEEVKETILDFSQGTVKLLRMWSHDLSRVAKFFDRTACSTTLFCSNIITI